MPQNWTPKSKIAKAVYAAGFQYDPGQDIIFSRMDAWQRKFGYAYAYDLAAPATISAIIDCEPFFFNYNNKDWMIELWKGQYGLETGCEIGIYVSKHPLLNPILGARPHDPDNGKFFDCADNKEKLKIWFTLNRNGEKLFSRGPEEHWWLTGFKWGVLSSPEDLTVDLGIAFPVEEMRKAFIAALERAGYRGIKVDGESVTFTFDKPVSYQPRQDPNCSKFVEQARENNSRIVGNYQKLGLNTNDPNQIQDNIADNFIEYFACFSPEHFKKTITEVLKDAGHPLQQAADAVERVFKQNFNPFSKIFGGLISFIKKLFGR